MNADSVKCRLKKYAVQHKRTLQEVLTIYGLERTIYRISVSPIADKFTLKGGIFLYGLFEGDFARATTDIDLLAQKISNEEQHIWEMFAQIFAMEADDALRYDLNTLEVHAITEFKEYHGVNVSIVGYLDQTRVPVSIDIGFGDEVYPERTIMNFPVLLDMESPEIYAYSLESVIAEKFEAVVSLGYANSRYKDFYDIYVLLTRYQFSGDRLQNAIERTFLHRETGFDDIVAFEEGFAQDAIRQKRWNAFVKKKKAMTDVEFSMVIHLIRKFLAPIVKTIMGGSLLKAEWNPQSIQWE